jgi:hypothetical protein
LVLRPTCESGGGYDRADQGGAIEPPLIHHLRAIEPDIVDEAVRLLAAAEQAAVPLRLLGGVAIRLRTPIPNALARTYGDLDFVGGRGSTSDVKKVFAEAGYEQDEGFNALNGERRLVFVDVEHRRKADVFVGHFEMCHTIPVADRLERERATLPLAELLVTKLQIVELNEKDVRDAIALLLGHDIGDDDGELVNAGRVAELCAVDWGLWRTITSNIASLNAHAGQYALAADERMLLSRRIQALLERIESAPKSRSWRLRARIGERMRWYDLPEET